MGLDMYLNARKYVSTWNQPDLREDLLSLFDLDDTVLPDSGVNVEFTVAYWRKANAIHAWFVDNVQNGIDDCRSVYVSREDLQTLRDLCAKAVESKDATLLQPRSGFFFGSVEVDEWYWRDLEETRDSIDRLLTDPTWSKGWAFYYHSSW